MALYVAWDSLSRFALMQWVLPWARRQSARFEDARKQLTEELGREPTQLELMERLGYQNP